MSSISVIIPARNPGPFLREALASVKKQTRQPDSIVVVDDGSDDEIVAQSIAGAAGVTLIRQPPLGRSAARNRGAVAVDSDYLLFLDADDLLRRGALEAMGEILDGDPAVEMVHGRVLEFVDERHPPPPGSRRTEREVSARHSGCTLLRRSLWHRVGELDEELDFGEWIDWISRSQGHEAVVSQLDEVVMKRRLHAYNSGPIGDDTAEYLVMLRSAILRKRGEGTRSG